MFIAAATALATANAGRRSRPSTARTRPPRSGRVPSTRSLRTVRSTTSPATSTTGTLTRNTARRHHLAGPLGTALTDRLFALGWLRRTDRRRVVLLTDAGRAGLGRLGVPEDWDA